ncbi:MAG: glycosyltransferase family 2 protein [Actinomycetaceae bacterium]|nr:glycosyltransferase family 2 protein [Actinomycetaceae bacterium]
MPTGTAALIVTRGVSPHLAEVLRAVSSQTLKPDAIVVIDAGGGQDTGHAPLSREALPQSILLHQSRRAATLGQAIDHAVEGNHGEFLLGARWWWILHDDSIPDPNCLASLCQTAERGRSIAAVGPKQFDADGVRLLEIGILATRSARRLERVMPGEIDQGQYDSVTDVLAVGTAGMLLDPAAWKEIGGFDPALGPFGDGLDLGRRLHCAGYRVVASPKARILHHRASLPNSYRERRRAQLYNWAKAVPWWVVTPLLISLAFVCPGRALLFLLRGEVANARDEISAWLSLISSTGHLFAARHQAARTATVPPSALRPLEISGREISERRTRIRRARREENSVAPDPQLRAARDRIRGKNAVSLASILAVTAVIGLVMWPPSQVLTAGAWGVLPSTFGDFWRVAWATWTAGGSGWNAPPDPLLPLLTLILTPLRFLGMTPTLAASWLLTLALPLSALGGWLFAARWTCARHWRILAALLWAAHPALLEAAGRGMLAPVLVHIALPFLAAAWSALLGIRPALVVEIAHEAVEIPRTRWSGAHGAAALAGLVIAGGHPLLLLPLGVLAVCLGVWRRIWAPLVCLIPGALLTAPTFAAAAQNPTSWEALLTPGGLPDAVARVSTWQLLLGVPASSASLFLDATYWVVGGLFALWALVAVAGVPQMTPLSFLARVGGIALVALAFAGGAAARAIPVGIDAGHIATAWSGTYLSIAGLLMLTAAMMGMHFSSLPIDEGGAEGEKTLTLTPMGTPLTQGLAALGCVVALLAMSALPATRGDSNDHRVYTGQSPIPAVSQQGQESERVGRVLVLSPGANWDLNVDVWRWAGPSLADASPVVRHRFLASTSDPDSAGSGVTVSSLAMALTSAPDTKVITSLALLGFDTIVVKNPEALAARVDALGRAPGLEKVGATDAGMVWRIRPEGRSPGRVHLLHSNSAMTLPSGPISVATQISVSSAPATILLSERSDPAWQATVNGTPLETLTHPDFPWMQAFAAPQSGYVQISHSPWWKWPWRIAVGLAVVACLGAAVPVRRRG